LLKHNNTYLMALHPGLPGRASTRKVKLDFTGASYSGWQWRHLDHMLICTSLQTDNYSSTQYMSVLLIKNERMNE